MTDRTPPYPPAAVAAVLAASCAATVALVLGHGPQSRHGPPPPPPAAMAPARVDVSIPPTPPPTTAPQSTAPVEVTCEPAAAALVDAILSAALDGSAATGRAGLSPVPDAGGVWLVAVELADGSVGVWATDDPAGVGLLYAVDQVAQQHTAWPPAHLTAVAIVPDDPRVADVRGCLGR